MARELVVRIIGDASSYEKALATSARGTSKFNRDVGRSFRGVAAGSGVFRSLGRSIAFASGGFLAFAGGTRFLEQSISAARDAAAAQRQLGAQMKASGESFGTFRTRVEEAQRSGARFGFQNEEVLNSLTVLERGTGKMTDALRLQQLAADIARAKNIDLAAAAQTVAKVFGGQETALRRAVPGLRKTAHGWDLIREAQQKMAGQAAAGTTVTDRFNASLHDTQEIIGTALLPVLNKYLGSLSDWLNKSENQKKVQQDAKKTADAGSKALGLLGDAWTIASKGADLYTSATDKAARGAGPLAPAIRVLYQPGYGLSKAADVLDRLSGSAKKAHDSLANLGRPMAALGAGIPGFGLPAGAVTAAAVPRGPSAATLSRIFDTQIGRLISRSAYDTQPKQLRDMQVIARLLEQRLKVTKDVTRRLDLIDKLMSVQYQARQIRTQIAADRAQAALERAQRAQARRQARAQARALARETRQFRALGLGPGGQPLVPGTGDLLNSLRLIRRRLVGTSLDTAKRRTLLDTIFSELSDRKKWGKLSADVRAQIQTLLSAIDQQLKEHRDKSSKQTGFVHTSAATLLAGLGLSAAQRRALSIRLAGVGPGGSVPGSSGQFTAGVHVHGPVHIYGVKDVEGMEAALQKRSKQRVHNRRAPR